MREDKVHTAGAKHIPNSKCAKHLMFGALLEVAMLKKWTRLLREAHLEVRMVKTPHGRDHFVVEMSKSAPRCGAKNIAKSKC